MPTFRLIENVKEDALKKPKKKEFDDLVAAWDFDSVQWNKSDISGESVFGCKCGKGKCKKWCKWETRRIDKQRSFTVENTVFLSYNVQKDGGSYAGVNIQCNVQFTAQRLRWAFDKSLESGKRTWMVNDAGKKVVTSDRDGVVVDKKYDN